MDSPLTLRPARAGSVLRAILIGGIAAGIGDYVFAILYYNALWNRIARRIAGGVMGLEQARAAGVWAVPLGILLHFVIATGAATVFVLASRKLAWLTRYAGVPAGLIFGAVVCFFMSWVVVPLSALGAAQYPPPTDWWSVVGHMFVVGLPIGLAARWFGPARA